MSADMRDVEVARGPTPTRSSQLGAKGAGEAGRARRPGGQPGGPLPHSTGSAARKAVTCMATAWRTGTALALP